MSREIIVCKFGGTSLSNAVQFRKVRDIIEDDPRRRYIVVSALGADGYDEKVTDNLDFCHWLLGNGQSDAFNRTPIRRRYDAIGRELGLQHFTADIVADVERSILQPGVSRDYIASRGEWLNATLVAEFLGVPFVDATEVIRFDGTGKVNQPETDALIAKRLAATPRAVIPGFYGVRPHDRIQTFPRGGSDITGALIARGVKATLYENWTDVDGVCMADPRVVANPRVISHLTYQELRELTYSGATMLHEEAIFPVRAAGIPVRICNTNRPENPGTVIGPVVPYVSIALAADVVVGVAGRRGFTVIEIYKPLMNDELGLGRQLLSVLEAYGISWEHMPTGIDTMSVVVSDKELQGKSDAVIEEIRRRLQPETLHVYHVALIAVVGRQIRNMCDIAARLLPVLAEAHITVRFIIQGPSMTSRTTTIIVGIDERNFEEAIRAIYEFLCE